MRTVSRHDEGDKAGSYYGSEDYERDQAARVAALASKYEGIEFEPEIVYQTNGTGRAVIASNGKRYSCVGEVASRIGCSKIYVYQLIYKKINYRGVTFRFDKRKK
jgi:hypothetical protein